MNSKTVAAQVAVIVLSPLIVGIFSGSVPANPVSPVPFAPTAPTTTIAANAPTTGGSHIQESTTVNPQSPSTTTSSPVQLSGYVIAFIVAAVFIILFLIVFVMYLNKMFCFKNVEGISCIEAKDPDAVKHEPQSYTKLVKKNLSSDEDKEVEDLTTKAAQGLKSSTSQLLLAIEERFNNLLPVAKLDDVAYIEISFIYNSCHNYLTILVKQAFNLVRETDYYYQVHVTLEPSDKFHFLSDYGTTTSPKFASKFNCYMRFDDVKRSSAQLTLYGRKMLIAPSHILGQAVVSLAKLRPDVEMPCIAILGSGAEVTHIRAPTPSSVAEEQQPLLNIGLAFNDETSSLIVEIGQAYWLDKLLGKEDSEDFETYIKMIVFMGKTTVKFSDDGETRLRKGSAPNFSHRFTFKVPSLKLQNMGIRIFINNDIGEPVGWISIGLSGDVSPEGSVHWRELMAAVDTAHRSKTIMHNYFIKRLRPEAQYNISG